MGMTGGLIALQKMEPILGLPSFMASSFLYFTGLLFVTITLAYAARMILYFKEFKSDLTHPVKMHFLPTFSVSLLLLSIATLENYPVMSKYLWLTGTGVQLILTLHTMTEWIQKTHFEVHHANPSWFIPILGNMVVPVAGVVHAPAPVNWFFFSVGLFFWAILFAVLLNRLIFHKPVPSKMIPTFFILMAPPAIGFISYVKLNGSVDNFATGLYSLAIFLFLFLCAQWRLFRSIHFYLSWWAYSFPLAALDLATVLYFHKTGEPLLETMSIGFFYALIVIIALLVFNTLKSMSKGQICVED